jgi:hypothetical protein
VRGIQFNHFFNVGKSAFEIALIVFAGFAAFDIRFEKRGIKLDRLGERDNRRVVFMRFKLLDALFVKSICGLLREGVETKKNGERKSKKGAA